MRLNSRSLRPHVINAEARIHAKRLVEQWRAAGLAVDIVEYLDTSADAGGYTVTARSATSVLSCRCQSWLARGWWRRRPLWTIAVSVRGEAEDGEGAKRSPLRPVGTTAAWRHDVAWERIQDWLNGAATLPPTLDEALAALR